MKKCVIKSDCSDFNYIFYLKLSVFMFCKRQIHQSTSCPVIGAEHFSECKIQPMLIQISLPSQCCVVELRLEVHRKFTLTSL